MSFSKGITAAAALVLAFGCSTVGPKLADLAPEINATYEADRMGILPGDVLAVRFTEHKEWDHETRILPDGTASFLNVGTLRVGGLSIEALQQKLTTAYAATIREYELTVFVKESGARTVTVTGAVQEAGIFPLPGRMTLLDALGVAGGADEARGNLKNVMLVRWLPVEGRQRTWEFDIRTEYWPSTEPVVLQPYDIVYVPLKAIVHVDIWVDQYIRQLIPFPYLIPPFNYQ